MPYLVHCKDRPGVGALRQEALADHFAYVEAVLDKIAVAGPDERQGWGRDCR